MKTSALDILLVEDSQSDVDLFIFAHQANGTSTTVKVARDGVEAVEFLFGEECLQGDGHDNLPRLVLLDLNMPRRNGFEVLELLRANERTRLLRVVIFSASDQKSDEREAQRLGANGYVRKPLGFEELCATLAQIERNWIGPDAVPANQLP